SFASTLTTACSSSAGVLVAVFDSGRLICTSGWSFLNVVETTKKISRIVRMSTSETMMIDGARRLRTANFTDVDLGSRHGRDFRRGRLGGRHRLGRSLDLRLAGAEDTAVVTLRKQIGHQRFHFHGENFYLLRKVRSEE